MLAVLSADLPDGVSRLLRPLSRRWFVSSAYRLSTATSTFHSKGQQGLDTLGHVVCLLSSTPRGIRAARPQWQAPVHRGTGHKATYLGARHVRTESIH